MHYLDDVALIEAVIRHCKLTDGIDCTDEALTVSKTKGYINATNGLTHSGRTVAVMMLIDLEKYQEYFDVTVPKQPEFHHQQVRSQA